MGVWFLMKQKNEKYLKHGRDWTEHKYIYKYRSSKSGKMIYVYPEDYKPEKFESTEWPGGKKGYVDERGFFWQGTYEEALGNKYRFEVALSDAKANKQFREQFPTVSDRINDAYNDVKNTASSTIKNGKNFVANILSGASDILDDASNALDDASKKLRS